jgi:hypothetical protein
VTVIDLQRPVIVCPRDITVGVPAGTVSATVAVRPPKAADNCSVYVEGVRSDGYALGDPYPLGTTTITWTATDASGNTVFCSSTVTVSDKILPDVSPTITASSNVMHGITDFNVVVRVTELNKTDTRGLITVIIPKDSRLTFNGPYDPALTMVGTMAVNNAVWTYDGTDPDNHVFTTMSVIPGGTSSTFGFRAKFDPGKTRGIYTITSQILSPSGGEIRVNNNVDSEKLDYFAR